MRHSFHRVLSRPRLGTQRCFSTKGNWAVPGAPLRGVQGTWDSPSVSFFYPFCNSLLVRLFIM
jgi:hypothetical protein